MKKRKDPAWFRKLASELARRNTGKVDVSVAQTSEVLGHLCDIVAERCEKLTPPVSMRPDWHCSFGAKLCEHGRKRAAAKGKK